MLEAIDEDSISFSSEESVSNLSSVQPDSNKESSEHNIALKELAPAVSDKNDGKEEAKDSQVDQSNLEDDANQIPNKTKETETIEEEAFLKQKLTNHNAKMQEIEEQDEDEEEQSSMKSPIANRSEVHIKSDHRSEDSNNDSESSESEDSESESEEEK
eukprot:CAMPEP_0168325088 /NCGR_PEP_ID=MMETSP0213-20121227/4485_1 /TAXON_ID=151035 /ORGANISM="Euplotes harpa, Strain FSP1.4" /LENGTH=157 /DNA_ID=CAMNT_0008327517 /DNA_START=143 /DNA_END=617 /DNA_ORIENTATION=-